MSYIFHIQYMTNILLSPLFYSLVSHNRITVWLYFSRRSNFLETTDLKREEEGPMKYFSLVYFDL